MSRNRGLEGVRVGVGGKAEERGEKEGRNKEGVRGEQGSPTFSGFCFTGTSLAHVALPSFQVTTFLHFGQIFSL